MILALLNKFVYDYRGNNTYLIQEKTALLVVKAEGQIVKNFSFGRPLFGWLCNTVLQKLSHATVHTTTLKVTKGSKGKNLRFSYKCDKLKIHPEGMALLPSLEFT